MTSPGARPPVAPAGATVPEPILRRLLRLRADAVLRRRRQVRAVATADSIHDLRVASRRLQELLDLFEPVLPAVETRAVRKRTRRIRRDLNDLRDADILSDLVADLAGQAHPGERPALLALERRLTLRAGRLRGALAHAGREGVPVKGMRKRLRLLLEALPPVSLHRLAVAGREGLRRRDRELRFALGRARTAAPADLHALRIAVKRWRYSLELLQAGGLRRCPKAIAAARQLQTALGGIHDLDVLIAMVGKDPATRTLAGGLRRTRMRRVRDLQAGLRTFRGQALAARRAR
jgi:CHAD domain-containing protein